jgi:hypothetical protein
MTIPKLCGNIAITISCAIVLICVVLGLLAIFCLGMGAYESATNLHAAHDTQIAYENVSEQIGTGTGQIQQVIPFTTRYWPEETPIRINKTGV